MFLPGFIVIYTTLCGIINSAYKAYLYIRFILACSPSGTIICADAYHEWGDLFLKN